MNGSSMASQLQPAMFPSWLASVTERFRHADRAVPFRPNRFLSQIEAQAELNLGTGGMLHRELCEERPEWAPLLDRLRQCHERSEEMHLAIAKSLRQTYITPLDSEDLLGFSLRLVGLVEGFHRNARLIADSQFPHRPFAEPQKRLVACCESLVEIASALERKQPPHHAIGELWNRHRAAKHVIRERIAALFEQPSDALHVARNLSIHRGLSTQARRVLQTGVFVRGVILKNG